MCLVCGRQVRDLSNWMLRYLMLVFLGSSVLSIVKLSTVCLDFLEKFISCDFSRFILVLDFSRFTLVLHFSAQSVYCLVVTLRYSSLFSSFQEVEILFAFISSLRIFHFNLYQHIKLKIINCLPRLYHSSSVLDCTTLFES